jgi:hypothetical protein
MTQLQARAPRYPVDIASKRVLVISIKLLARTHGDRATGMAEYLAEHGAMVTVSRAFHTTPTGELRTVIAAPLPPESDVIAPISSAFSTWYLGK